MKLGCCLWLQDGTTAICLDGRNCANCHENVGFTNLGNDSVGDLIWIGRV